MKEQLRIGYSMWGFLGDIKCDHDGNRLPNGSPDGCASYVWVVWHALQATGHVIYSMQEDRDFGAYGRWGRAIFRSHAEEQRCLSYVRARNSATTFPPLDVLVLEWRFAVPGKPSQDVERQTALLEHYSQTDTKIVIWDLDHKLTSEDERRWPKAIIAEQSATPRFLTRLRETLFTPVDLDVIKQSQYHRLVKNVHAVYVGNNYNRERAVDQYLAPLPEKGLNVQVWGKWEEVPTKWRALNFNPRIDLRHFARAFSSAACSPLLAMDEYFRGGVVTARVGECLQWGTIPVGFTEHKGIFRFTPFVANTVDELANFSKEFIRLTDDEYDDVRDKCIDMLSHVHITRWIEDFKRITGER